MSAQVYTHWHEIVLEDIAFEIIVSYTATPGSKPVFYGDHPYPGDDPEFEIQSATFLSQYGWADFPLTSDDHIVILQKIADDHEFKPDERDPDDWRDSQFENARIEQMYRNDDALIDF